MAVLATWVPEDAVLGAVAPLALAASTGTCLVIDLDPAGPEYPGSVSLLQLVRDGPRADDLSPNHGGVAVLRNGGVAPEVASDVVNALISGWPSVVLRMAPTPMRPERPAVVPIVLDAPLAIPVTGPRVVQRTNLVRRGRQVDGVIGLPLARRSTIAALLSGRLPGASRWMRTWHEVWTVPWR